MPLIRTLPRVLILMAIAAATLSPSPAGGETITLAADVWCPFNCDPGGEPPGYMVEVAKAVFEPRGHTVSYQVLPWARAVAFARRGDIIGLIGPYKADVPDFIFPDNELAMIGFSIFVAADVDWNYTGLGSLTHISLGVINDYAYSPEIDDYILTYMSETNRIQVASGERPLVTNIQKLLHGRIDALIETPPVFHYAAGALGVADRLKSAGTAVAPQPAYIAFSPKAPQAESYARILSDGIAELRRSGRLSEILARYGLTDWKE